MPGSPLVFRVLRDAFAQRPRSAAATVTSSVAVECPMSFESAFPSSRRSPRSMPTSESASKPAKPAGTPNDSSVAA